MDWYAKAFIRASLLWFVLGITLGLAMAIHPAWVVYRPAHAHMNLVGFVVMMIFGVGYQMLPRFFGHPIHSSALASAHIWLANLGLTGLVAGFMLAPVIGTASVPVTAIGGSLWAIGAYGFAYNMWRTFDAAERRRKLNAQHPNLPLS
ncbi:MAG: cbb3-type cytochrome c oxidase subunit I [Gemmatimonas sp.]